MFLNVLSTFFKIHRSPGYAQAANIDHRLPSNKSALASGAVSPGPSLAIKTDRLWPLGRHPLDHRFPFKQVGSGLWAASYGPCFPSRIDRLWHLGRHPLSAVRARDNGSSGHNLAMHGLCTGYAQAMHRELDATTKKQIIASNKRRVPSETPPWLQELPWRPKLRAEWNSRPAGILSEAKPTVMAMHGLSADSISRSKSRTDEQNQAFAPGNRCMEFFGSMPNHSVLAPSL